MSQPDPPVHGPALPPHLIRVPGQLGTRQICLDCAHLSFNFRLLNRHGKEKGHEPHGCACGKRFRTYNTYITHLNQNKRRSRSSGTRSATVGGNTDTHQSASFIAPGGGIEVPVAGTTPTSSGLTRTGANTVSEDNSSNNSARPPDERRKQSSDLLAPDDDVDNNDNNDYDDDDHDHAHNNGNDNDNDNDDDNDNGDDNDANDNHNDDDDNDNHQDMVQYFDYDSYRRRR
ncbi:hypothetical protein F5Y17DRAFT_33181 [Xylariaceae sp. FL0594]|nr:hypothetical protein F5Y17DRAFT_33181 [Xylariaceae sp. FL0594]